MSCPAYDAFGRDIRVGFAVWRVYQHLVHAPILTFAEDVEVKVWALSQSIVYEDAKGRKRHMSRRKVADALDWLVQHGYIIQASRDSHRVRTLRLAFAAPVQLTHAA